MLEHMCCVSLYTGILISSETHKAIDNVFERLPKIAEIRPLRLIPSQNGKETNYSPERLVDNFYLNIQESLRRQVDRFEHFHETKESFSEKMRSLRFDYDKILRLQAENAGIEAERKRLIERINTYNSEIEDLREQLGAITEEIEAFTRTIKHIESYRFVSEGAKSIFIERYRAEVQKILSEFSCFADRTPDDVRAIVTADLALIESEIASICGDDRLVKLEAERKSLQAEIGVLAEDDAAFEPGTDAFNTLKAKRGELIELKKQIELLQSSGSADVSDGELIKVVSSAVIADKSLVALLPDQIKNFKIKLTGIISDIRDAIDRERATYAETENTVKAKVTDKQRDINEAKTRYEELGENPGLAELSELSAQLKQKIGRFFRNFGIVREYDSIENALEIIREEWNALESDYARTQTVNRQRIPMFKDICKYLDSPDILEEDRQAYTRMLYDNVNVFGITCTSRDRFTKMQLQELGKYGIDSVDIRTQGIDVVIIDEVSKSSFLDLLIPILYGKTIILVGDHRQLPPMYDLRHMRESDFEGLDEDIITKKINDGYSLHSENEQQLGIINIFNEWHAQTTSHKVRATFQSKAKRGERLATNAPYGYIKDPDDSGHIIPDPDTKDIVIRIFREFLKDSNLKKIAKGLQNDRIITPGQYLYQKYRYVHSGVDITDPYRWSSTTIRSILRNQDYIGNTVNCKTKVKSFKVKKQIRLPKEEWLIFENTHEALVSKVDFETVQLILDGRNRPDKSGKVDIFHNVIACASCGNRMYIHRAKTMRPEENYYSCGYYQRKGKDRCSAHQINAMALEQIVLQQIRWVTELARENPEVFYEKARAKKRDEDEKKLKAVKAEIVKTKKRIDELDRIIQKLYEDNVSGRITDERYDKMSQSYETEQSALSKKLAELEEAEASHGSERNSIDDFIANANRFIDIQELTPEIVHAFVSKIYVYEKKEKWSRTEGNDIDIVFTVGFREQHTVRTSDAIAS